MENEHEVDLQEILRSYKVADADDALLERIVAKAEADKVLPFTPKVKLPVFTRYAAMAAALAVAGFFCGSATLGVNETEMAATPATNNTTILYKVILGPKSYSEINL